MKLEKLYKGYYTRTKGEVTKHCKTIMEKHVYVGKLHSKYVETFKVAHAEASAEEVEEARNFLNSITGDDHILLANMWNDCYVSRETYKGGE